MAKDAEPDVEILRAAMREIAASVDGGAGAEHGRELLEALLASYEVPRLVSEMHG